MYCSPAPPVPRVKRLIDLTGAVLLLIATAPLLLVISLVVAVSSPGGVLYRQRRTGHGGQTFDMLKFRTMRQGAHAQRAALAARNESGGGLFKIRDDPRVTRVGRQLRLLSLDELPQLVNVVRGDMSLVGPRPLPVEDSGYTGPARARLDVLPGLTGLWQVSGRSELSWEEMVRLDLHYVRHWSVRLDLKILARTLPVVLAARGAH
ncbi:sugar transferase [Streptomyces sp. NPDC050658]|uniref:sugar transferase n=1 Tax=unclassified Streptomyces TaxID=2593676 RepID=UPI00343DFFB8